MPALKIPQRTHLSDRFPTGRNLVLRLNARKPQRDILRRAWGPGKASAEIYASLHVDSVHQLTCVDLSRVRCLS
ncbi:hypothetical protein PILCRDRAFT_812041 [Piloderma croceum F 1598]|uniref:Uncharacterized protein n=1 Tax=Piloderma croceum (strain F 1598) TaxID=765440 RepID=A0A0C3CKT9_PILCF|nr:hypothetical protein PILCRDRAFT_812041 [Piloderma croceum F 1598]